MPHTCTSVLTTQLCAPLQRDEFLPEVTMDPMRGPRRVGARRGMADDDEDEDEDFEDEQDPFMP